MSDFMLPSRGYFSGPGTDPGYYQPPNPYLPPRLPSGAFGATPIDVEPVGMPMLGPRPGIGAGQRARLAGRIFQDVPPGPLPSPLLGAPGAGSGAASFRWPVPRNPIFAPPIAGGQAPASQIDRLAMPVRRKYQRPASLS